MKILAIGNSFSDDATRYLYAVARAAGYPMQVANLYIGGCSLALHHKNMQTGERAYTLGYNGHMTGFPVSLEEGLTNRVWDVITVQQASTGSFKYETYQPYLDALVNHVRQYCPKAKIVIHQTWAYEDNSERLLNVAKYETSKAMSCDIVKAYTQAAKDICADGMIPSGEMFDRLKAAGITHVHRDTYHASLGLGRYALALLWYRLLCNKSVLENDFCDFDEEVSPEELEIVRKTVEGFSPIF